jgi:hypothetical protein
MLKFTLALLLVALATAGGASAGGWATVGVSPSAPDDLAAGGTWNTTLTVLQHGQRPLEGISPSITIRNGEGEMRTFAGTATGEPGKYAVAVTFPSGGSWTVAVDDDFSQVHTFGAVSVSAPAGTTTGREFPLEWTLGGVVAALAAAASLLLVRRRGSAAPVPTS